MSTRPGTGYRHSRRNREVIDAENETYAGSGGVSEGNSQRGFRPAFLDTRTGDIHLSRFADGRPAPVHLVEGLPAGLVLRAEGEGPTRHAGNCIAGFILAGRFLSREEAAREVMHSDALS